MRRTVYGKVSRYKLDEYLQLFDFPSPSISAEKRFVTTVPLQRLFLMNSDFMQSEAEELAKRVANEPDNRARIKKAYEYVYGRDATEEEIALGLQYLKSEPMLEYDEAKTRPPEKTESPRGERSEKGEGQANPEASSETKAPVDGKSAESATGSIDAATASADPGKEASKSAPMPDAAADTASPETPAGDGDDATAAQPSPLGMGMMGGMGRPGAKSAAPEIKYDATVWGRYAKILFSSSQFVFIN